ncbi:hypothetical protein OVA03_11685 [Asticcacaulis sp. SL142]|uniref:hypothetical protein n=1 Tax=Asticcacaulis sp. SL142 TaxID=2995155 RepID=UPI00226CFDA5|nr:hypothetical protein [Asticcacaulis sp. SL142]WAC47364.1 hypothetical protein OVA03_11685 [Asticcacaulis sp. SL142]
MDEEILKRVGKRIGDMSDLPESLKKQLQINKMDELEEKIINVIDSFDKIANIDEILVGLYRKYELLLERTYLSNKLYRMTKANLIESVREKKGVYRKKTARED